MSHPLWLRQSGAYKLIPKAWHTWCNYLAGNSVACLDHWSNSGQHVSCNMQQETSHHTQCNFVACSSCMQHIHPISSIWCEQFACIPVLEHCTVFNMLQRTATDSIMTLYICNLMFWHILQWYLAWRIVCNSGNVPANSLLCRRSEKLACCPTKLCPLSKTTFVLQWWEHTPFACFSLYTHFTHLSVNIYVPIIKAHT